MSASFWRPVASTFLRIVSGWGIRLYGSSSGYVGLKPASAAGSTDFTLPASDGTNGQALVTNGSGILSFTTIASTTYAAGTGLTLTGSTFSVNASQTQITSVGTIGTGVWQGTAIAGQYGGTGVANAGKTITLGGNLTTSGAFATTLTVTADSNVTLPTSGTLAALGGTNTWSSAQTFSSGIVLGNTQSIQWTGRGSLTSDSSNNIVASGGIISGSSVTVANGARLTLGTAILTSPNNNAVMQGSGDVANPAAQTLLVASVVAGTSNTAGADWTQTQSLPTGTGAAGNKIYKAGFSGVSQSAASVTMTIASPCVVTLTSHGFVAGQPVTFATSGALPTGITAGTTYYVSTVVSANTFQISTTAGGSAVNTSGSQSGSHTLSTSATVQNPAMTYATWGPSGLTGSQATSLLSMTQSWNTSGTPTAVLLNVLDTASNGSSLLMDLQIGGTSKCKVDKSGSITAAGTLTSRIKPRTGSTTSSATPTINTDNVDQYYLTAQAVDITSMTTNLSGTPNNGQSLLISITGTAARAITWGTGFESGPATLPTTTVTTQRLDVQFIYNSTSSKFRCMASGSA